VTQKWNSTLIPSTSSLLTKLLPSSARQDCLRARLEEQVDALVRRNVENLRWAALRGLNETFRRASAQLDQRLADALAVTQGAITAALERRQAHADQAAEELERSRMVLERLTALGAELDRSEDAPP
jgi:hypothetical protein